MNIVFFHANCCDGLFGAYAAWKQFQGKALLIPIDYSRLQKQTPDEFISHYLIENFDRVVGANPVLQVGVKPYILRLNTI